MGSETPLQSEMIFEILSRASLETLEQCKSVSKDWKQIIYEPTFLPLHSQRTNSLFGYFFQYLKSYKHSSAFISTAAASIKSTWPSDDMEILASCDQGILIFKRRICYNNRFYACKPSTNLWQALPNPKLRYQTKANSIAVVVVQSQPLRYVIARLYTKTRGTQHYCEIFDSDLWRWENINCPLPSEEIVINSVTTSGQFVHWLTFNDSNDKVLTLDVEKRCFTCCPVPEIVPRNAVCNSKSLMEYEGGLGFMCLIKEGDRKEMELWVKGEKKMVVNIRDIEKDLDFSMPVEFWSSKVVFMQTSDGGYFYNLQNCSFTKVELPKDVGSPKNIFRFRSDAEVVNLKGGRYASQHKKTIALVD